MQSFKPSLFRWPFLCLLVCWAVLGSTPPVQASPPTFAAPAQQADGSASRVCPEGYVRIEPGTFVIGSPFGELSQRTDEKQHSVTITRAYCMKATEVTQGEWQAVIGSIPSRFTDCGENCPVEQVSWYDAVGYANALSRSEGLPECYASSTFAGLGCTGYRLPTEAEWEYAAGAGTPRTFSDGNLDSVAWFYTGNFDATHPVRQKQPNAWGLYDMLGNVWEWTDDWYVGWYQTLPMEAEWAYAPRVTRGGAWNYGGAWNFAPRSGDPPGNRSPSLGFRLVRTAP
jgi:formylglycine-generating enzyme required for sulfatase activity